MSPERPCPWQEKKGKETNVQDPSEWLSVGLLHNVQKHKCEGISQSTVDPSILSVIWMFRMAQTPYGRSPKSETARALVTTHKITVVNVRS